MTGNRIVLSLLLLVSLVAGQLWRADLAQGTSDAPLIRLIAHGGDPVVAALSGETDDAGVPTPSDAPDDAAPVEGLRDTPSIDRANAEQARVPPRVEFSTLAHYWPTAPPRQA